MSTVDELEASEQDCSPRELIEIAHGTTTHYLTTGTRDISYGGHLYKATAAARGETGPVGAGTAQKSTTLTLPIDHAYSKRWLANGSPPKLTTVVMRRYYTSDLVEQFWEGEITSMACNDDNTEAVFNVAARAGRALLRVIPNVTVGRTCPHPLYGTMCRLSRSGSNPDSIPFACTTTVLYVNGRDVRVDLSNVPADDDNREDWLQGGEFKHTASGEVMTILKQADVSPGISTVTLLTLDAVVYGMKVGDSVTLQAGCDRTIATCDAKFGNRANFGGFNKLPTKNIFNPTNTGVSDTGEF